VTVATLSSSQLFVATGFQCQPSCLCNCARKQLWENAWLAQELTLGQTGEKRYLTLGFCTAIACEFQGKLMNLDIHNDLYIAWDMPNLDVYCFIFQYVCVLLVFNHNSDPHCTR